MLFRFHNDDQLLAYCFAFTASECHRHETNAFPHRGIMPLHIFVRHAFGLKHCVTYTSFTLDHSVVCGRTKSFGYLSSHYDLIVFVFNNVITTTYLHTNICLTNTIHRHLQNNKTTKYISHCYYVNVGQLFPNCVTFLNEINTVSLSLVLLYAQHSTLFPCL